MKLDILAIAAHPDDVELCCAGTLLRQVGLGQKAGVVDLTRGELGTRGTPELRLQEAEAASKVLGLEVRDNLSLPDGFFQNDRAHQLPIIIKIRQYRPDVVLTNAIHDRHPDHGRASELVSQACFYAGLKKIETELDGQPQEAWRPRAVYHFIQDRHVHPDLIVDITDQFEQKMEAIRCFASQFYDPGSQEPETPLSTPEFLEFLEARAREFGRPIGVAYGEGFTTERPLGVDRLNGLL